MSFPFIMDNVHNDYSKLDLVTTTLTFNSVVDLGYVEYQSNNGSWHRCVAYLKDAGPTFGLSSYICSLYRPTKFRVHASAYGDISNYVSNITADSRRYSIQIQYEDSSAVNPTLQSYIGLFFHSSLPDALVFRENSYLDASSNSFLFAKLVNEPDSDNIATDYTLSYSSTNTNAVANDFTATNLVAEISSVIDDFNSKHASGDLITFNIEHSGGGSVVLRYIHSPTPYKEPLPMTDDKKEVALRGFYDGLEEKTSIRFVPGPANATTVPTTGVVISVHIDNLRKALFAGILANPMDEDLLFVPTINDGLDMMNNPKKLIAADLDSTKTTDIMTKFISNVQAFREIMVSSNAQMFSFGEYPTIKQNDGVAEDVNSALSRVVVYADDRLSENAITSFSAERTAKYNKTKAKITTQISTKESNVSQWVLSDVQAVDLGKLIIRRITDDAYPTPPTSSAYTVISQHNIYGGSVSNAEVYLVFLDKNF
jgi:hypothetical protein